MVNIAAIGLYMLLTGISGNPGAVSQPVPDNSNPILVEQKKAESTNEIDKNVEAYVRSYFKDTPILADVARCESHFTQTTKSGKIFRGIVNPADVGVMQINETYHLDAAKKLGLDIYTLDGNLAFAKYLYQKSGTRDWMASSPCWSKLTLNKNETQVNNS